MVKNLPSVQQTQVWSLGWEDPRRREWQPTPAFLPGKWTEEPGGLQSMALQRAGHDRVINMLWLQVLTWTLGRFQVTEVLSLTELTFWRWRRQKINQKHLETERGSTVEKDKPEKVAGKGHCNFNRSQGRPERGRWCLSKDLTEANKWCMRLFGETAVWAEGEHMRSLGKSRRSQDTGVAEAEGLWGEGPEGNCGA